MIKKEVKHNNRKVRAKLVRVPYGILTDMNQILTYNWDEEAKHYEEAKMDRCHGRHIFKYMQRVRDWLDSSGIVSK